MEMERSTEKSSIDPASAHPMKVVTIQRNGWSQCSGMGGHNVPEWVVTIQRNQWTVSSGMSGHNAAEYAVSSVSLWCKHPFTTHSLPLVRGTEFTENYPSFFARRAIPYSFFSVSSVSLWCKHPFTTHSLALVRGTEFAENYPPFLPAGQYPTRLSLCPLCLCGANILSPPTR